MRGRRWLQLLVGIAAACAFPPVSPAAAYAHDIFVVDGDTVRATMDVWPAVAVKSTLRLNRIDAPELHRATPCEEAAGSKAKLHLEQLLQDSDSRLLVEPVTVDSFGRVIAELKLGDVNISDRMMADGMAVQWTGKRIPWPCEAIPL